LSGKDFGGVYGETATVSSEEHPIALEPNGKEIPVK
jgi:hypothetical protein